MNSKNILKEIWEWIYCIAIAIVVALLVKYFLFTPTVVQMDSMYPTLKQGDRLILNRTVATFKGKLKRGDIITFEAPLKERYLAGEVDLKKPIAKYDNSKKSLWKKFTYNVLEIGKRNYIKRVIGLPGEHVQISDGKVYIDGNLLNESYLDESVTTEAPGGFYDIIVPQNSLFVMGDHRSVSLDSRSFGCVPYDKIESRVSLRFWPLNKFGNVK